MQTLSKKNMLLMSVLLFSTLFGAGNLIFPPYLGHYAGENTWISVIGFLLSDVGVFVLATIAVAKAGSIHALTSRVNKVFAIVFPFLVYVCLGPGLAVPRAGSLAFEMGVQQFLPQQLVSSSWPLLVYTILFFAVVFWFSMSPSKLIDRFGKVLTPILLALIGLIFIRSFFVSLEAPGIAQGTYFDSPMIQGFLDGYLTMDGLAVFVCGVVIIHALREKNITEEKAVMKYMIYAGVGAGIILGIVYAILAYLGATTISLDSPANGAQILIHVTSQLFGSYGNILLGIIFTVACLCVSIGLVIACSQFFTERLPRISYKKWVAILCIISGAVANIGLTQIIAISGPILGALYPIFMVLVLLGIFHQYIYQFTYVYQIAVLGIAVFSTLDLMNQTILNGFFSNILAYIPLYQEGIGFVVPALVLFMISCFVKKKEKNVVKIKKVA